MTDDQIKQMVDRFLCWKLPSNFTPDGGISFNPEFNVEWNAKQGLPPQRHEPIGTNLFDASQAEEMVRHMAEGIGQHLAVRPIDSGTVPGGKALAVFQGGQMLPGQARCVVDVSVEDAAVTVEFRIDGDEVRLEL